MNAIAPSSPLATLHPEARRLLFAATRGEGVDKDDAARVCFPALPEGRRLLLSVSATGRVALWQCWQDRATFAAPDDALCTLTLTEAQWDDLLTMTRAACYTALAAVPAATPEEAR